MNATPPDSPHLSGHLPNLGTGLVERFARTGREADLQEAIRVYRRACELGALSAPQVALAAARNWGRWAVQRKQWVETAQAYGHGLDITLSSKSSFTQKPGPILAKDSRQKQRKSLQMS